MYILLAACCFVLFLNELCAFFFENILKSLNYTIHSCIDGFQTFSNNNKSSDPWGGGLFYLAMSALSANSVINSGIDYIQILDY